MKLPILDILVILGVYAYAANMADPSSSAAVSWLTAFSFYIMFVLPFRIVKWNRRRKEAAAENPDAPPKAPIPISIVFDALFILCMYGIALGMQRREGRLPTPELTAWVSAFTLYLLFVFPFRLVKWYRRRKDADALSSPDEWKPQKESAPVCSQETEASAQPERQLTEEEKDRILREEVALYASAEEWERQKEKERRRRERKEAARAAQLEYALDHTISHTVLLDEDFTIPAGRAITRGVIGSCLGGFTGNVLGVLSTKPKFTSTFLVYYQSGRSKVETVKTGSSRYKILVRHL